jgi:hypothetical protein
VKTPLNNNGSNDLDHHLLNRYSITSYDFCPFSGFDFAVTADMTVFDQHFSLTARIDQIEKFNKFIQFNKWIV